MIEWLIVAAGLFLGLGGLVWIAESAWFRYLVMTIRLRWWEWKDRSPGGGDDVVRLLQRLRIF